MLTCKYRITLTTLGQELSRWEKKTVWKNSRQVLQNYDDVIFAQGDRTDGKRAGGRSAAQRRHAAGDEEWMKPQPLPRRSRRFSEERAENGRCGGLHSSRPDSPTRQKADRFLGCGQHAPSLVLLFMHSPGLNIQTFFFGF